MERFENARTLIARILILVMAQAVIPAGPGILRAETTAPADAERRVRRFGEGAEVKVTLTRGGNVRGHVESLGEDSFLVADRTKGDTETIPYLEVKEIRYPHRGYTAEGEPDPVAARAMVLTLGVGEHIMVKTGPDRELHGYILDIGDESFLIRPDNQKVSVSVPYTSVQKVHKNLSFGATLAIVVLIGAVVVLTLVLTGEDKVDVLPN